jgi:hypothetical protein
MIRTLTSELAAEAGDLVDPPPEAPRPAVESARCNRWSFEVTEPRDTAARNAKREKLAAYVAGLLDAQIVGGETNGTRCRVFVETSRLVAVEAARGHSEEWPWTCPGSFAADVR